MSGVDLAEIAALGALAASRVGLSPGELARQLRRAGVADESARLCDAGLVARRGEWLALTPLGIRTLLDHTAAIQAALDPPLEREEECPSLPWLTTVQTQWIDALSMNYAVDPDAARALLPAPLSPSCTRERAWVQVLMSSLRDMRPQGMGSLFGVCFYQVSYRAAVRYRSAGRGLAARGLLRPQRDQ